MFYDVGKKLSCLRLLKKFTEQTTLFFSAYALVGLQMTTEGNVLRFKQRIG